MQQPMRSYWHILRQYIAPQRGTVLLMVVALLASVGLQLAGPNVVSRFLDAARAGAPQPLLVWMALTYVGIMALAKVCDVLVGYWAAQVAWTATNALREELTAHLLSLGPSFCKARLPGELIERVDGDVNGLAESFSSFWVNLVGNGLLLAGIVAVGFWKDVRIGLALLLFAAVAAAVLARVRRPAVAYVVRDREQSAALYGYLGEAMAAAEGLRSQGAVPYALRRLFEHLRSWVPVRLQADLRRSAVWMTAVTLVVLGTAVAFGVGGALYQLGAISLGTVYLVIAYMGMMAGPIDMLRTELQKLQGAEAGIQRVRELLETRSVLVDGTVRLPAGPLAVEFRDVHFRYDDEAVTGQDEGPSVLQGVSFRLEPGRTLGLLGRTGSGKTTVVRLLFRFHDPQQGEVLLGGVNLRDARLESVRSAVGLVTQDVQIMEATLRDNITFFDPEVRDDRLLAVIDGLGFRQWVDRLPQGLDTPVSPATLSAGEAQLVALARVFLKDPGLVILDEATSRLDPATEALQLRAFERLLRGRTAIVVAHRLSTVERMDDILILEGGRVVEYGPRAVLAADPRSIFARYLRTWGRWSDEG